MSEIHGEPRLEGAEQRSSVEITLNAKGDHQVKVKVYAGEDEADLEAARLLAIRAYNDTLVAVRT